MLVRGLTRVHSARDLSFRVKNGYGRDDTATMGCLLCGLGFLQ